jgi:hypothetical protein
VEARQVFVLEARVRSASGLLSRHSRAECDGKRPMPGRVVDRHHDRLAAGADAESVGALAVLDGDCRRHAKLGADIAAAVRALMEEVHGCSFLSARRFPST